jgi:hypothetical protein
VPGSAGKTGAAGYRPREAPATPGVATWLPRRATESPDPLDANRAYSRARALLAGVRPGHAPRNGYGHRITAHLRAACRSHLAPKIGHEGGGASNRAGSRSKAVRSRLRRPLPGHAMTSQNVFCGSSLRATGRLAASEVPLEDDQAAWCCRSSERPDASHGVDVTGCRIESIPSCATVGSADASGVHARMRASYWPVATSGIWSSAMPSVDVGAGSCGLHPGWPRRPKRSATRTSRPVSAPTTVTSSRPGAMHSTVRAISLSSNKISARPFASTMATTPIRIWLRPALAVAGLGGWPGRA